MLDDLFKKTIKGIYLIPSTYWNSLFGVGVALISVGIGSTVLKKPDYSKDAVSTSRQVELDPSLIEPNSSVPIPPSVITQNVFRNQRTSFTPPPGGAKRDFLQEKDGSLPEIKLRGTMIFGDKRVAIIDGVIRKYVKVEKGESYELSGAKYLAAKAKGLNYQLIPVGEEKLDGQSFYEGSEISNHIIERVLEDGIEVINIGSGKRTLVYLNPEDHKDAMARKLSGMESASKKPKKRTYKYGDVSGAGN